MDRPSIKLGDKARDTVTGYKGIVVCISDWLSGCRRISIQSKKLVNGVPVDAHAFDAEQVEVITSDAMSVSAPSGGPCPDPTRNTQP